MICVCFFLVNNWMDAIKTTNCDAKNAAVSSPKYLVLIVVPLQIKNHCQRLPVTPEPHAVEVQASYLRESWTDQRRYRFLQLLETIYTLKAILVIHSRLVTRVEPQDFKSCRGIPWLSRLKEAVMACETASILILTPPEQA